MTELQIQLRRATPADAERVAAITEAAYEGYIALIGREPQPMTADYQAIVAEHSVWLLATAGTIAGLLVLMREPETMLIYSVAVHPAYQGRGFGSRLLALAEDEARAAGYTSIRLYTNALMEANIARYLRRGYEEIHRETLGDTVIVHFVKPLGAALSPRPAELTDEAEWLRMRAALWPDEDPTESAETVRQFLTGPEPALQPTLQAVFVCPRATGGLCGFVEVSIRPYAEGCETTRVGYIEGWYVDPEVRHRGVGRQLIAAAEAWARGQGCTEMASDAELDNTASQQAHQRLGYTEVERIVCFRKTLSEAE